MVNRKYKVVNRDHKVVNRLKRISTNLKLNKELFRNFFHLRSGNSFLQVVFIVGGFRIGWTSPYSLPTIHSPVLILSFMLHRRQPTSTKKFNYELIVCQLLRFIKSNWTQRFSKFVFLLKFKFSYVIIIFKYNIPDNQCMYLYTFSMYISCIFFPLNITRIISIVKV